MPRVLFGVTVAMTAQAFLRDQMTTLAAKGWDVHLACSADDGTDSFARLHDLPGVTFHDLPMARPPRPAQDVRSLRRWLRLVDTVRPDVVVASTPKAGLLGTLAARMKGVPARVYHVRGLRAEGLSGPLAGVSRASERLAIGSATDVLVDSPSLLTAMRRDGLLPTGKGAVLGHGSCCGVDTTWFRPPTEDERRDARTALGFTDDDIVIGFIGRLTADKGIRELVVATDTLHDTDPRVRLALVGPTEDDDMRPDLTALATTDWARLPGPTSDPRSVYWAFDVFCLPSYREGFPVAPLEAQACGLPLVTTDATGCVDAVEADVTGLVIPVRDANALRTALQQLTTDDTRRTRMGAAARERTVRDFDQVAVRERVVSYIERAAIASGMPKKGTS